MKKQKFSFDSKWFHLANHFLFDSNIDTPGVQYEHAQYLAQEIQNAIEDYFKANELDIRPMQ